VGLVHVEIEVSRDGGPRLPVEFLVDSGAKYSVLPRRVWRHLALEPKRRLRFRLADGTPLWRSISECRFTYEDTDAMSPVVLGGRGDVALLGAVTLETLGLVLNPFTRRLRPARMMLATLAWSEPRSVCRILVPPAPESTVESLIEALGTGPRADPEFLGVVEAITRTQPCLPCSPWDE
jgi:predicted aspartyl protease